MSAIDKKDKPSNNQQLPESSVQKQTFQAIKIIKK
jgi:hypothetical protein